LRFPDVAHEVSVDTISRRRFVFQAAGLVAAASGGASLARLARAAGAPPLPPPAASGIEHVVVVMMENRSFDHFLGWLPGADGQQAGLSFADASGARHATSHLTDFMGCDHPDPDHGYEGGRAQFDDGKADGWLQSGQNDVYSIGYYQQADLAFFGRAAVDWTVCDRWFSPILGPTYPNRIYQHAGTTDRILNSTSQSQLPTIWDRCAAAGVSHAYYFSDVPFTAIWGDTYIPISRRYEQFVADCATGTLPQVSFVDPRFLDEDSGSSGDDHPHADIRVGERFLADVYEAVTTSPLWKGTVLIVDYDEWGGFFDHVPPPRGPDTQPSFQRRGFRIPNLVVSPFARRRHVAHDLFDHTSVLKLIEWRFGLPALAPRDAAANSLASVLDFSRADLAAPGYDVPRVVATPCAPVRASAEVELADLLPVARRAGFAV
jgi:phospholipase C